jgi:hypothetical protein
MNGMQRNWSSKVEPSVASTSGKGLKKKKIAPVVMQAQSL